MYGTLLTMPDLQAGNYALCHQLNSPLSLIFYDKEDIKMKHFETMFSCFGVKI